MANYTRWLVIINDCAKISTFAWHSSRYAEKFRLHDIICNFPNEDVHYKLKIMSTYQNIPVYLTIILRTFLKRNV